MPSTPPSCPERAGHPPCHTGPSRIRPHQSDFGLLWAGATVSGLGSQVTLLALPLLAALRLGASPEQMGLLAAAETAPSLLVGLFAGVWVDRLRRRPLLIAADLGRAMLLLAVPIAAALGTLSLGLLYAVALGTGALTVLFDVAQVSLLPSLVGRERLMESNSRLESSASAAQVAGPALGGWLVGLLSAPLVVLIDAASFLISALLLAGIRTPERAPPDRPKRGQTWNEIREGVRTVSGHPVLRALAGCSAVTNLFGLAFMAVYVLYMTRELGLGAEAIGIVFATGGLGALTGALIAAPVARRWGQGTAVIGAQFLFGVTGMLVPLAVLAPTVALPMIVASEFLQWLTLLVFRVNAVSLRQAIAPERLQGRVNATFRFLAGGMQPVGALLGGALGALIGLPWTLIVAECGMFAAFLWLVCSPVRSLDSTPAPAPAEAPAVS